MQTHARTLRCALAARRSAQPALPQSRRAGRPRRPPAQPPPRRGHRPLRCPALPKGSIFTPRARNDLLSSYTGRTTVNAHAALGLQQGAGYAATTLHGSHVAAERPDTLQTPWPPSIARHHDIFWVVRRQHSRDGYTPHARVAGGRRAWKDRGMSSGAGPPACQASTRRCARASAAGAAWPSTRSSASRASNSMRPPATSGPRPPGGPGCVAQRASVPGAPVGTYMLPPKPLLTGLRQALRFFFF